MTTTVHTRQARNTKEPGSQEPEEKIKWQPKSGPEHDDCHGVRIWQ